MTRVLVLDAEQRSALAVVRSLGRQGATVIAASSRLHSLGAASRHAHDSLRYPDPTTHCAAFLACVDRSIADLRIDFVVPTTDSTTMLLLDRATDWGTTKLLCAPREPYNWLSDKQRLIELAGRLGVPVPVTIVATEVAQIRAAAASLGFPLILKPGRSKYRKGDRIHATAVRQVADAGALERALASLDWLADVPCLVQQFIPGYGAGVFAMRGAQGTVAWFAHRRLREKPPSGGVSVLSESVPTDATLRDYADRLLQAADWFGPAMVEFRISPAGVPYLMEINGRFWGSLQLAIDSGVDFPALLLDLGRDRQPAAVLQYALGRRLRWLLGDVDNLLIQLRRPVFGRPRLGALYDFARTGFDPGCRQEVFRWNDPMPALTELRQWLSAIAS